MSECCPSNSNRYAVHINNSLQYSAKTIAARTKKTRTNKLTARTALVYKTFVLNSFITYDTWNNTSNQINRHTTLTNKTISPPRGSLWSAFRLCKTTKSTFSTTGYGMVHYKEKTRSIDCNAKNFGKGAMVENCVQTCS